MKKTLLTKIKDRSAKIGVIGLGYVGLPLAVEFAEGGFEVTGFELLPEKVKAINSGRSYIDDVPDSKIAELSKNGTLKATLDDRLLAKMDCVSICVPTPLSKTKDPDISYILAAVDWVKKYLHKEMLVVLESTTYPGTTDEVIKPILESGGFKVGRDFYLAFSPERVDPGNPNFNTKNTPRVVGGRDVTDVEGFLDGRKRDFSRVFGLLGIVRHVQSEPSCYFATRRALRERPSRNSTGVIHALRDTQARPFVGLSAASQNILLARRCE